MNIKKMLSPFAGIFLFIHIYAQPYITSFTPVKAIAGATVTITGANFNPNAALNAVYFGQAKAIVQAATATAITVTVPSGATYQPITVTTGGLTAYSKQWFLPTFDAKGDTLQNGSFYNAYTHNFYHPGDLAELGKTCVADFDGDGKPDVIVDESMSIYVRIFKNTSTDGTISFKEQQSINTADDFSRLLAADINGDGKLDMVAVNYDVRIFINTSSGQNISFASPVVYNDTFISNDAVVADFDLDGKPDIAVIDSRGKSIAIFKNTSTPDSVMLAPKISFETGGSPGSLVIADINQDGLPDMLERNFGDNNFSVFKNISSTNNIAFAGRQNFDIGDYIYNVAAGDLNDDGKPDVIAASGSSFLVFTNTGINGNISFATKKAFKGGTLYPVIGDANGDGKPDIILQGYNPGAMAIYQNACTADSIFLKNEIQFTTVYAHAIYMTDADGDGKPDFIMFPGLQINVIKNRVGEAPVIKSFYPDTGTTGTKVTISGNYLAGASDVRFGGTPALSFTVKSPTSIVATVAGGATGSVTVTTPVGSAAKAGFVYTVPLPPVILSFTPNEGTAGTVVTINGLHFMGATSVMFGADNAKQFTVLNDSIIKATVEQGQDGMIVVTTPGGTTAIDGFKFILPSITSFTPMTGPPGTIVTIKGKNFSDSLAGNFVYFGVARADVLVATDTALYVKAPAGATWQPITVTVKRLTAYSARPFAITFKGGNITQSSFVQDTIIKTQSTPYSLAAIDFDRDKKTDLVVANGTQNAVSLYRNSSNATKTIWYPVAEYNLSAPQSAATGDLNGDGRIDFAMAGYYDKVSIFKNATSMGVVSFLNENNYSLGDYLGAVTIADIDVDGKPDFIAAQSDSRIVSIFKNTSKPGTISFQESATFDEAINFTVGDINGDNKPDLVIFRTKNIFIYKNISTGGDIAFAAPVSFSLPYGRSSALAIADLDGDERKDIVIAFQDLNRIVILKNTSSNNKIAFSLTNTIETGTWPEAPSIADLNGDGKPDMVVACYGAAEALLFQNNSINNNILFTAKVLATPGKPVTSLVTDINGDGRPEILLSTDSSILMYKNATGQILPLTLLSFTGSRVKNTVQLHWQTENEQNTASFTIERGETPAMFNAVGTVAAAGNSAETKNYFFTDESPQKLQPYYRLKMVDADGNFSYSNVIKLQAGRLTKEFTLYPNPAKSYIIIRNLETSESNLLKITDMTGKTVKTINLPAGTLQSIINVAGLAKGNYNVAVSNKVSGITTRLLVVQ